MLGDVVVGEIKPSIDFRMFVDAVDGEAKSSFSTIKNSFLGAADSDEIRLETETSS